MAKLNYKPFKVGYVKNSAIITQMAHPEIKSSEPSSYWALAIYNKNSGSPTFINDEGGQEHQVLGSSPFTSKHAVEKLKIGLPRLADQNQCLIPIQLQPNSIYCCRTIKDLRAKIPQSENEFFVFLESQLINIKYLNRLFSPNY